MTRTGVPRAIAIIACVLATLVAVVGVFLTVSLNSSGGPVMGAARAATPVKIVVSGKELGVISRYLFGSNLLWPYDGEDSFNPHSGRFYSAFVEDAHQIGISSLRYPGGTVSDSFDWWRAIGPRGQRQLIEPYSMQDPRVSRKCCILDQAQQPTVGPDQYGRLLDQIGAIGTVTVNFATGTAQEAADFAAYMTAPQARHPSSSPLQPSYWAALRAKDGHPAPYNVPYWEVGNEQNGPSEYGWRAGRLVSIGPHRTKCTASAPDCLYVYGGTTSISHELVGTFADTKPAASSSSGRPGQSFFVYFPPVVRDSQVVSVAGKSWHAVSDLSQAGPKSEVYQFDPSTGQILFGDGRHGMVPPRGAQVRVSYQSGPHGGFVDFYAAIKKMNPHLHVCGGEQQDTSFFQLMGKVYRYDCVELHEYARPLATTAPLANYEERLFYFPLQEGADVSAVENAVRRYSGRDIPVVLTEYGQFVVPMPRTDKHFNVSLEAGVLTASQLVQWIDHDLALAQKYLLVSSPFQAMDRLSVSTVAGGLSVDNALIVRSGKQFVIEPSGYAIYMMSRLGGAERLRSFVAGDPVMAAVPNRRVPVLETVAAVRRGHLYVAVINTSPASAVPADIDFQSLGHSGPVSALVLDGDRTTAYNVPGRRQAVAVTSSSLSAPNGNLFWTFPAHSVTLLELRTG